MKVISKASDAILNILKSFKRNGESTRFVNFYVEERVCNDVLIFNLLTRELLLLSGEEYQRIAELDYLKDQWFLVPEDFNEKESTDLVKYFLNRQGNKEKPITGYTIFTTTDCNARCFYCFELGRSRIPMSREIAQKTLQYIKDHCGGKSVKLAWFGGEPLMNTDAIDIICQGLADSGISHTSRMTSNGYLFNDELVERAGSLWNLKRVQITLDGTETIYNKIKAFVYENGNPYQIVLDNIGRLLDRSIHVTIRLNMDLHNAEDLLRLAKELSDRFEGRDNLFVYAHHLFKSGIPMAQMHTEEEWQERDKAMQRIEETLDNAGLSSKAGIAKKFKTAHCMADSGSSVTILPDGNIGLCEHYSESEFIGHLDREGFDQAMIASWKERTPEIPECAECFYYPQCIKLKKCSNSSECYPQYRAETYRKLQRQMRNEYEKWKTGLTAEEPDDIIEE